MYFYDRKEAGQILAKLLVKKYKEKNVIVYALPRGGVITGREVAKELNAPLDLLITRKIGHPSNTEYALAVVSEDGYIAGNEEEIREVDQDWLQGQISKEKQEIKRRRNLYLHGRRKMPTKGAIAIIVDDGIATGLTMHAAIKDIGHRNPKKIVVAVPIVPWVVTQQLKPLVDEIVAITIDEEFLGAVGTYYQKFPQVTDDEVIQTLSIYNGIKSYL